MLNYLIKRLLQNTIPMCLSPKYSNGTALTPGDVPPAARKRVSGAVHVEFLYDATWLRESQLSGASREKG